MSFNREQFVIAVAAGADGAVLRAVREIAAELKQGDEARIVPIPAEELALVDAAPALQEAALIVVELARLHACGDTHVPDPRIGWLRRLSARTEAVVLCSWEGMGAMEGVRRRVIGAGAHYCIGGIPGSAELVNAIRLAHRLWAAGMPEPKDPAPLQPEPPRKLTFLVGNDAFNDVFCMGIRRALDLHGCCRFLSFKSEADLWRHVNSGPVDLICACLWNVPDSSPPGMLPCLRGLQILGQIRAEYGIPVIATQGMDLRSEAEALGITFLKAPFLREELLAAVRREFEASTPPA